MCLSTDSADAPAARSLAAQRAANLIRGTSYAIPCVAAACNCLTFLANLALLSVSAPISARK